MIQLPQHHSAESCTHDAARAKLYIPVNCRNIQSKQTGIYEYDLRSQLLTHIIYTPPEYKLFGCVLVGHQLVVCVHTIHDDQDGGLMVYDLNTRTSRLIRLIGWPNDVCSDDNGKVLVCMNKGAPGQPSDTYIALTIASNRSGNTVISVNIQTGQMSVVCRGFSVLSGICRDSIDPRVFYVQEIHRTIRVD
jgi:hypothetical protein